MERNVVQNINTCLEDVPLLSTAHIDGSSEDMHTISTSSCAACVDILLWQSGHSVRIMIELAVLPYTRTTFTQCTEATQNKCDVRAGTDMDE